MKINSIRIQNFRSIKDDIIEFHGNNLVLVGKNNAGKSSMINALRAFWGDIEIVDGDYHKQTNFIQINIQFIISNAIFLENTYRFNTKIGIEKIPSTVAEFNANKENTFFKDDSFSSYKELRDAAFKENNVEMLSNINDIWLNTINTKLKVIDNKCSINFKIEKGDKKGKYTNSNEEDIKDLIEFLSSLAFIDDNRNFDEEGEGKARTLTNSIFGKHILKEKEDICQICTETNCENCIEVIKELRVEELSINDLEKLMNNKIKNMSSSISRELSEYFQHNFQDEYKIMINTSSNINKSFSLNTKIYVPALDTYVEISKVGAGLRSVYILSLLQTYLKLENSSNHIFLIEEPEIYLHPTLQKMMAKTLNEMSQNNMIILSTHSPLILNQFEISNVKKVFLNQNNETNFINADLKELLIELGYSTSDVLFSEYVIFVEGKDDKLWISKIIENYYDVDINKFFIVDSKSCNNIETYATLRFLNKTDLLDNFLILRDSDTMNKDLVKRKIINAFNENLEVEILERIEDKILILNYSSFENYFLNPSRLIELGVIRTTKQFTDIFQRYLDQNHQQIFEYLEIKNNLEIAIQLIDLIYDERTIDLKIEDLKIYLRGHNIFGQFQQLKNKTEQYISISDRQDFEEILLHLEKIDYLRANRKT